MRGRSTDILSRTGPQLKVQKFCERASSSHCDLSGGFSSVEILGHGSKGSRGLVQELHTQGAARPRNESGEI